MNTYKEKACIFVLFLCFILNECNCNSVNVKILMMEHLWCGVFVVF